MSTPPSPLEGFSQTYSQQYYQYRGAIQTFITDVLREPEYIKLLSLKDQVSSSIMVIPTEITHTMTQFVWTETTIRVGKMKNWNRTMCNDAVPTGSLSDNPLSILRRTHSFRRVLKSWKSSITPLDLSTDSGHYLSWISGK